MAKLTRGDWLEVIREVRESVKSSRDELHKWENKKTGDGGKLDYLDVDKFVDQMTPAWRIRLTRIANAKEQVASKRREWNNLKRQALGGKDQALSLAWLEWMFESDMLSEGFDDLLKVLPDSFDPKVDPRSRAAMFRGGFPVPELP